MNNLIFVADDDQDDWFILEDAMRDSAVNAAVDFFINGEKLIGALEDAILANNLPGLIVLDLNMPRLSGTETLAILKKDDRFIHIPVIIYSTSVNVLEKQKCLRLGARDYITKPVSLSESVEVAKLLSSYIG